MISAVFQEPFFLKEINGVVRNSASEQSEFIKALQSCDLEKVLDFLEKGKVDPFEVIAPADELARQLFSINEKTHFLPYPEEDKIRLEDFSKDCTMQAWMLISIFSEGDKEGTLKTQVISKIKTIVGDDYDKKHQELSDEIKKKRQSVDISPPKDVFNVSYQKQLAELERKDKELIKELNKKD